MVKVIANFFDKKMCFWTKKKKHNNNNTKYQTKKLMPEPEIEPRTSCTQKRCVTKAPPSQLRAWIVVKLFNCFDAMGRNVNKQSHICRPEIFYNYFSVIFLHA